MKIALTFPGQASQYVGMGKELAEAFPAAATVFDEADEALAQPFRKLLWEGPQEALNLTANTQPAVLAVSVAAHRVLLESTPDLAPVFLAGHSLGEYSAHVCAGTLTLKDALQTVRRRGEFMQDAVPEGEGAMAALMGLDTETVASVCEEAAQGEVVSPANDNAPGQIVIAGGASAVSRAVDLAKERGCRRAVLLPVSAPFHCALMAPARERLTPVLDALTFHDPKVPVVTNVDVAPVSVGNDARVGLIRQVDHPVRWLETLLYLKDQGVDTLIEVGPGSVLSGLAKRVSRDWKMLRVENPATLETALATLTA